MPNSHAAMRAMPDPGPILTGLPAWSAELALDVGLVDDACRLLRNQRRRRRDGIQ